MKYNSESSLSETRRLYATLNSIYNALGGDSEKSMPYYKPRI